MSASSKKKLRKEQNAAAMTQKQQQAKKDAKTLKTYTMTFIVVMVLVIGIVLSVTVSNPINVAIDRGTHAISIGEHDLTIPDLTYFYVDAIQNYYSRVYDTYYNSYPSYWQVFLGFDPARPLDDQTYNLKDGSTWADYFMDLAIDNACFVYGLVDKAAAEGYTLPEEEQKEIDKYFENMETLGFNLEESIKSKYSNSVTVESYKKYYAANNLADSFFANYAENLKYEDKDYREFEKGSYNVYSSFTYAVYAVSANKYLTGGTKDDKGNTTYSDKEKAEALEKAQKDMQTILDKAPDTVEKFDEAIKALEINKDVKTAACTQNKNTFYNKISNTDIQKWVGNVSRKPGDLTSITVNETVTLDDGSTTLKTSGYYIVLFQGREDHKSLSVDVRHILVKFAKADANDKSTTYTQAEKDTAKQKAEAILKEWKEGEKANQDTFAELAKKKSEDTGSKSNGGLYEDIYKGEMVAPFEEWCYDKDRKPGDTGIVETEYGYHVMYFVETNELSYRDLMIKSDMVNEDSSKWSEELADAMEVVKVDLSRMKWDYVVGLGF